MFIKSGRVETLATLLALDTLFVEWCSVNCHESLEKIYHIFVCTYYDYSFLSRIYRNETCGALGSSRRSSPAHGYCFDATKKESEIDDSKDNTEAQSVHAEPPGKKAGLWPGVGRITLTSNYSMKIHNSMD